MTRVIERIVLWLGLFVLLMVWFVGLGVCLDWFVTFASAQDLTNIEHPIPPSEIVPAPPQKCGVGDLACPTETQEIDPAVTQCEEMYIRCAKWIADQQNLVNAAAYKGCTQAVHWVDLEALPHFRTISECQANLGACGYTSLQAWMAASWVLGNCEE